MGEEGSSSQGRVLTTAAGLRFPCPKNFSGKDEDWDLFQYKFRAYMCLSNPKFKALFELSQASGSSPVDLDLEGDEIEQLVKTMYQEVRLLKS